MAQGKRSLIPTGEDVFFECDDVLIAVGQSNSFPWVERDLGIEFDQWDMPVVGKETFQTTRDNVFIGGDAAFGPENVITAVAQGHQAAISIDLFCQGDQVTHRPEPGSNLVSQKMGIHEWSYDSSVEDDQRHVVPLIEKQKALSDLHQEVELGFDATLAFKEAERCLNCDAQTVFTANSCIECDACVDICPTDCLTMTQDQEESELRQHLTAPAKNLDQLLYVSDDLATGRVMVKDEKCLSSLWSVCRALSYRCMGYAKIFI